MEDVRVRIDGGWYSADVDGASPVELRLAVAGPVPREGVLHLAIWDGSKSRRCVYVQGDILETTRARGATKVRLRYKKLFSKHGRHVLDAFVKNVMGRDGTEPGAYRDGSGGCYYHFALEAHAPTMAMLWRPTA